VESLFRDIIDPLKQIGDRDFPKVQESLELFRGDHAGGKDAEPSLADSLRETQAMLDHMRKVLFDMDQLVGFHAMTNSLKDIIQGTDAARQQANKEGLDQLNKLKLLD
jgi:hypothetical protein